MIICTSINYSSATEPPVVIDMQDAVEMLNTSILMPIEGIWEFPQDHVKVLIKAVDPYQYTIRVVEGMDGLIVPGTEIGELTASPSPDKFDMKISTPGKNNIIGKVRRKFTALLKEDGNAIEMEGESFRIKINPSWFLPHFWRFASIGVDRNKTKVPRGLIKLYPNKYGVVRNPFIPIAL